MTKNKNLLINKIILVLSIVICFIYGLIYINNHNYFMVLSNFFVIFLVVFVYFSNKIIKRYIPEILQSLLLIFVFFSSVLGIGARYYDVVPHYDKVMHFTSGILFSVLFVYLCKKYIKKINLYSLIFCQSCFNATVAVVWEINEFVFDLLFHKGVQKGLTDTMTDMIAAIIGGIIVSLYYIYFEKKKLSNKIIIT